MRSSFSTAAFVAGTIAAASAQSTFNANSKTNIATYWGQGPNQRRLVDTCARSENDIVVIGFVNQFPDNTGSTYPGTNFGNACWGDVYNDDAGKPTKLLKTCPNIGPDVISCQRDYGKKILLSLGGGYPTDYRLNSDASGRNFADFLWKAWGPIQANYTGPRPWGNAVVDGFDFDIESVMSPAPSDNPDYQTRGYAAMINYMKNTLFPTDSSKYYYISGAPQCVLPDAHFSQVVDKAWFDFLFIQFYNTPQCSARAGINKQANSANTNDITFTQWSQQTSLNKNVKMYIGLPAATGAAASADYLTPQEVRQTVQRFYSNSLFGGIMLWESTYAMNNVICNKDYTTYAKDILVAQAAGRTADLSCPTSTTTSSSLVTSSTRSTTSSSRPATTTTSRSSTSSSRPATTTSRSSTSSSRPATTTSSRSSTSSSRPATTTSSRSSTSSRSTTTTSRASTTTARTTTRSATTTARITTSSSARATTRSTTTSRTSTAVRRRAQRTAAPRAIVRRGEQNHE